MAQETSTRYNEILCIGLGLSGVCLGAQLRRKFGFTDIHLYDRNVSHSGTWQANHYPGCACDVPAIFYSFSFEMNPSWTRLFPSNEEIKKYLEGIVDKYKLRPRMTFQTECEVAKWDEERHIWVVHLRNLVTGDRYKHECRLLFSAVGVLVEPKYPNIQGTQTFEGPLFHTAQWRSDVDLSDKNVVLLGNGCSATQTVPVIAPTTKTLTQFINTPHWLVERHDATFGTATRLAFTYLPLLGRLVRLAIFLAAENDWRMFYMNKTGAKIRKAGQKAATQFTLRTAPKKYHDILIPDWEYACKRRIFDVNGVYLKSLHAPNVHLTKDPIVEILPRGVRTATKTYPADVIVLATGFHTNNGLGALRIEGRNGERLEDHWEKMGGPGAYNSTAVHGFPNFMMIYGPNTTTGHSSVVLAIENGVNYALKIIEPVLRGEASEVEVKAQAEQEYGKRVQEASRDRLWNSCKNWYVTDGWNSTTYPWSQFYFWWRSAFPKWTDWTYKYTTSPSKHRSGGQTAFVLVLITLGIVTGIISLDGLRHGWVSRLTGFASH